jgi:nitronate monooxygenase
MLSASDLQAQLTALKQATDKPFNVNFFCHAVPAPDAAREAAWREALKPCYLKLGLDVDQTTNGPGRVPFNHEAADVLEAFRPAVVSFHFGLPAADLVQRIKSWGSRIFSSATTEDEALWLQAHGADAIIAQGLEAGGHRGMFLTDDLSTQMGTFALLPQIVQAVNVPVIAAGGIASAAGVRAAKALGAAGVQMGSAYLCSDEASTSALHRAALQSPSAGHTALTNVFTGRPARGIVNRVMRKLGPISPLAPAFPLATAAMAPLRAAAEAQGSSDFFGQAKTPRTSSRDRPPPSPKTSSPPGTIDQAHYSALFARTRLRPWPKTNRFTPAPNAAAPAPAGWANAPAATPGTP